ncbi:MAG: glucosamine-6-phosphate deaminase [Planctomycetaceae bacterium]
MHIIIAADRLQLGSWVADHAAAELQRVIADRGEARLLIATGSSQFEVLDALSRHSEVDWSRVTGFHLDEYIGLSPDHPASFCGYLRDRFVSRVPLKEFHYLRGDADAATTIAAASKAIRSHASQQPPIDVALVGIGENGHLAFNDPPADFNCEDPYIVVKLDEACRKQQVGEGWFSDLSQVPQHAMSMSIRQIMKAAVIFCSVPDERKATAVKNSVEGDVTPDVPASILQNHPHATLIIDRAAASLLSPETVQGATSL